MLVALGLVPKNLAQQLALRLSLATFLVFLVAGSLETYLLYQEDRKALETEAHTLLSNIALALSEPVAKREVDAIARICDRYDNFAMVLAIQVVGIDDKTLCDEDALSLQAESLQLVSPIRQGELAVGRVLMTFSLAQLSSRNYNNAIFTFLTFALTLISLITLIRSLLQRYLAYPLQQLQKGLFAYAQGRYEQRLAEPQQEDLKAIVQQAQVMAKKIASRERALERKNYYLNQLNAAISALFSLSQANLLLKHGLDLLYSLHESPFCLFTPEIPCLRTSSGQNLASLDYLYRDAKGFSPISSEHVNMLLRQNYHMVFPLLVQSQKIGDLYLAIGQRQHIDLYHTVNPIVALMSQALSRIYAIKSEAYHETELKIAQAVQTAMLPQPKGKTQSFEVSYAYEPMLAIGGDWFYFSESAATQEIYCAMGDVTGHGLASGLVATAVSASLRTFEALTTKAQLPQAQVHAQLTPAFIMSLFNRLIYQIAGSSRLGMSCVILRLDLATGEIEYCNAGHPSPLLIRDQEEGQRVSSLGKNRHPLLGHGTPLEYPYTTSLCPLPKKAVLLLYTDGLTEASSPGGQLFGRNFVRMLKHLPITNDIHSLKETITSAWQKHTQNGEASDDMCLLLLKLLET